MPSSALQKDSSDTPIVSETDRTTESPESTRHKDASDKPCSTMPPEPARKKSRKKKPDADTASKRVDVSTLPRVNEDVIAQNLVPNCECPLTPGCNGRIRVLTNHKRTETDDNGTPVKRVNEQYLRCSKCLRMPVNPRRIEQPLVNSRLFDRHRKKSD